MGRKFTDNAVTTLASSITNLSTTLSVVAGTGTRYPALVGKGTPGSAKDYSVITLEDASGNIEKIRAEERVSDVLGSAGYPLIRGYDGTVARSWLAGDLVDLRWEHAGVQDHEDKVQAGGVGRAWGNKDSTTVALNYGYYGSTDLVDGVVTTVADGTVPLTLSAVNYVERTAAGVVSANVVGFSVDKIPMAQVVTDAIAITTITDKRAANQRTQGLVSVSIAGGAGTQVLTADQVRAPIIVLTGAVSGDRAIEFPNIKRDWVVVNSTTGSGAVTPKVTGQTGVAITRGRSMVVYGNGTDIASAVSDVVTPADLAAALAGFTGGGTTSPGAASANVEANYSSFSLFS